MRASLLSRLLILLLIVAAAVPLATSAQGNSEAAKACQQDGYKYYTGLVRQGGQMVKVTFKNTGECVSYVARGGTLVPITVGGGETMTQTTTAVYRVGLFITFTSHPPTQLEVCGFSAIPGAIGGNPDIGEDTGILKLFLGSTQVNRGAWIRADCVILYPLLGSTSFPSGSYRLEIMVPTPPTFQMADFAYFTLP